MSQHRQTRVGFSILLLLAACVAAGCRPPAAVELSWGSDKIVQRNPTSGYSEIWLKKDLPELSGGWCVDGLTATYQARPYDQTTRAELDLFAVDPTASATKLATMSRDAIQAGFWQIWSGNTALPSVLSMPVALQPDPPTIQPNADAREKIPKACIDSRCAAATVIRKNDPFAARSENAR